MCNHKPICCVVNTLVLVGALNWGLVGIGSLAKINLNLVNLIFGSWPVVESVVYILVGVAAVMMGVMFLKTKDCPCNKVEKK